MRPDRADVLVIGSGAAGAAITKRLAEKGAKVVCLEQGDWRKPGDYPSAGYDIEAQFLRPEFSFSPNTRKRLEDYPIASAGNNPPDIEMVNAVGGTTTVWACEFLRLRPSDFRTKMLDGVAQDWPLGYRDLEKYYALNERETGVSGMPGDPGSPGEAVLLPPLPLDAAGHIAAQTLNRLGWHWWIFNIGFLSRPYEGRPACDLNTPGWYGCGPASRASTDVTYWPRALRRGAILQPRARVREITVDASGRAKGAVYYDERGDLHEQLARVVVVCANGIGTPRLLLNSKSKLFPQGLANSSGLLGKGLMLHVWLGMRGVLTACTDSHLHPVYKTIYSGQFYETDKSRNFSRGYTLFVSGTGGPLTTALRVKAPWGAKHHETMHNAPSFSPYSLSQRHW